MTLPVHLDPPDAAQNARWFQAIAWQGGGLRVVGLHAVAPGTYVADAPLPVGGKWKTMLRLHTGAVMMSAPIFFGYRDRGGGDPRRFAARSRSAVSSSTSCAR